MGWRGSGQQSAKHFRGGSETLNLVVVLDSLLYRGFDWLAVERTVDQPAAVSMGLILLQRTLSVPQR